VLGAAAFLIAEFLKISYFDVILMAIIPTLLYYFAIWVMVEIDASKHGGGGELMVEKGALWRLFVGYWFHFGSLISIIVFMLLGFSPCWRCSGRPCWPSEQVLSGTTQRSSRASWRWALWLSELGSSLSVIRRPAHWR
jgi:TRAP-type uncharacterized transport system, fused permease components